MIDNLAIFITGILFGLILDNGARMLWAWWQVHGRTPVVQGAHVEDDEDDAPDDWTLTQEDIEAMLKWQQ